jgi:hypothetical protein
MNQSILFEDIFEIKALNENGKKFERGAIDNVEEAPRLTLTHLWPLVVCCDGILHSEQIALQGHDLRRRFCSW